MVGIGKDKQTEVIEKSLAEKKSSRNKAKRSSFDHHSHSLLDFSITNLFFSLPSFF